jgi:hypothetical protein
MERYRSRTAVLLYALLLFGLLSAATRPAVGSSAAARKQQPVVLHADYLLDPLNPEVFVAVKLELAPSGEQPFSVSVQLGERAKPWYPCSHSEGIWLCWLNDRPSVQLVESLQVVVQ